ncbi:multicopper oxidase-domain-containing protein [Thelonectria olida]|uniref:Multicopper oxidase-domain-containing protein n=1 Tax=Thelonectria olida TaxID=1576542 RepID=A0A9P8VP59_9HYPO|nr:multicopper oxidase-domain-containing protein [Thelonectria olida]
MGFFKRLVQFLLYSSGFNHPDELTSELSPIDHGGPVEVVDVYDPSSIDGSCNTPTNRQCWSQGFDIHTDYELQTPTGVVRKFILYVSNEKIAPDGYLVPRMLFNGTYPGPTLEGNWGDTFEITVRNNLTNFNGTSVHWHGIRQLNTNWMDGVAGVTECPITPGEEFTYVWNATQYGTSWYHSHFSLQYPDGLVGALKINGPTSMNYDVDLGPVLITDNFHGDAFSLVILEYLDRPPTPDSMLMNGKGKYYCCKKTDPQCVGNSNLTTFNFEAGKTYKMSLVNTATSTQMTFWIDNHSFSVVAADFVPITPYNTSILNIAIGQRYEIIVHANASTATGTNFWIHARDCSMPGARSELGIIRYDHSSETIPWTPPVHHKHLCHGCLDVAASNLKPIVPRTVDAPANGNYTTDSFKVHQVGYPDEYEENSVMHRWVLKDSTFYLDWREPSLSLIKIASDQGWEHPKFPKGYEPVDLWYKSGSWVYFLIEGKYNQTTSNATHQIYQTQPPVAHPIHVHGHDFVILAQGTTEYNSSEVTLDLDNPARRDVAMLPVNGYLILAFQIDNPGAWLMHCHIAWHASGGLALQFVESPDKIGPLFERSGIVHKFSDSCNNWGAYYTMFNKNNNAKQEDSGI